jgi:CheY-like chemotaxis protein
MAKIMLIEDAPDTRDLVSEILEMSGHTIEIAETGEDGLAKVKEITPDVVLVDVSLPGKLNGLDVVRHLRQDSAFDKTPLLALTAHVMATDREQALEAGCDDHITKPIVDLEEFAETVSRYAAQGRK